MERNHPLFDLPFLALSNRLSAAPRSVETHVPLFVTSIRPSHVQGLLACPSENARAYLALDRLSAIPRYGCR